MAKPSKRRDEEDEDLTTDEDEAPRGRKGKPSEIDEEAAVDFDEASDGNDPKFPVCTVDAEIQAIRMYQGNNPDIPGEALMFEATFKVYNVVDLPPELEDEEYEEDEERPPHPVRKGEIRMWRTKVGPVDRRTNKPPKGQGRARDLVQAALRFEPRGKLAESATEADGKTKLSWNKMVHEAKDKDNPLAGCRVRIAMTRIITRRGKGNPMYVPSFSVPDDVEARATKVVDSL